MATRKAPPGGKRQWTLERPRGAAWRWRSKVDPRTTVGYVDGRTRVAGRFRKAAESQRTLRDRQTTDSIAGQLLSLLETAGGGFKTGARDAWNEGDRWEGRATDLRELGDDFTERWRRILEGEEGATLAEVRERHPGLPTARDPEGDLMIARQWEMRLAGRRAFRALEKRGFKVLASVETFVYNASHQPRPEQSPSSRSKRSRTSSPSSSSGGSRRKGGSPVGAVERPGSPYWRPREGQQRAAGHAARVLRVFQDRYEGELLGVGLRLRAVPAALRS